MSANIKASVDGTQAIIGVGGVDQMTVSNAGVVTANSFVGLNNSSVTATGSTTARTLANRFADVVNVKDFGAVGDGVADDTAAIQAALNQAENGSLFFPIGTYRITSYLRIKSNTSVNARAASFICESPTDPSQFYNTIFFDTAISFTPSVTFPLSANAFIGGDSVTTTIANAANFSINDLVVIQSNTLLGSEKPYREINLVRSVNYSTGQITLNAPLNFDYTTASSSYIAKVNSCVNSHWDGGTFDLSSVILGTGDRSVFGGWYSKNCSVNNVSVKNYPNKPVDFYSSWQCSINNLRATDPTYTGPAQGYGSRFAFSRFCIANNIFSENTRHGFDITGGSDYAINDIIVNGRSATTYNTGIFFHGLLSKRTTINNCVVNNTYYGLLAGNGTFAGDSEFSVNNLTANGCSNGINCSFGSNNFAFNNISLNSCIEDQAVADNVSFGIYTNIQIKNGINPSHTDFKISNSQNIVLNGATILSTSGLSTLLCNNSKVNLNDCNIVSSSSCDNAIQITGLNSEVYIKDSFIDHSGSSNAINANGASVFLAFNNVLKNRTTNTGINAESVIVFTSQENRITTIGVNQLRGIHADNCNQTYIEQNHIQNSSEAIRIGLTPDKTPVVANNYIYDCATALRTTSTTTKPVRFENNIVENITSNTLFNSSIPYVIGNVCYQGGVDSVGDNSKTITVGTDAQVQRFDSTLTQNRILTINDALPFVYDGARFIIVRTGLGAFTLEIKTSSGTTLKIIPSATAASLEVMYNGGSWKNVSYSLL